MKVWTQIPIEQNQMAKPENLNDNIQAYVREFNGDLNGNNFPVYSLDTPNLKVTTDPSTLFGGGTSGFYVQQSTQGFYRKRKASAFELGSDIWTPWLNINLFTDQWTKGWNRLQYYSGWESYYLDFDAREGMLVGCATIDWQHGTDALLCATGDPVINFSGIRGDDWVSEWGVFVNDVLVARSGFIPPKRHTTSLPFSIPCGSQNIKVDVRWITSISDFNTTGAPHGSTFSIFSSDLWVRNVVR